LHSPSDPHVPITPKIMASWIAAFRGHHCDMMLRAARLYRLTGEKRYADWASSQLDFYADHLTEWKPRHGARLYYQTLTEAEHVPIYAEVVLNLGATVTAEHRERWRAKFFSPEIAVLDSNFQYIHNIATWQRAASAEVALVFGDQAMWRKALDAPFGLNQQLAQGITSDYIWWEQSLGYNDFVVEALLPLFAAAGVSGRADEIAADMTVAENIMLAPTYMRFPDGHLPNPADDVGLPKAPNRGLFASAYRVFPTPIGLAAVAGENNWNTLLDPPPPAPAHADRLPAVVSWNMESSRMAILRSGPWQIFFQYGQLAEQHSQAEALNFSAYYGDTDITHDAGTVGYGSPLHANYYTKGLAQNELLVDGEGEIPPQRGELLQYSAAEGRVSASQPHYRPDAGASRTLAIVDGRLVDTATIVSHSAGPHRLGLALHLQGHVRLPKDFQREANFGQGRPPAFGYWRDVRVATFHDQAEFDVDYDGMVMRVKLAVPGEFKLWHGNSPDSPPRRRDSFYAEVAGTIATFTTTFAPAIPAGGETRAGFRSAPNL